MKRAVVTGGAGFIGSHIVDSLVLREVEVLVIDDFSSGSLKNLSDAKKCADEKVAVIEADICDEHISREISDFKPQAVFHCAAQINVRRSVAEPAFDAEKNVVGTVNVLEAAKSAGVKKIIFSSTGGAIYGEHEYFPADEEHPVRPKCPYGVAKRSAELYIEYYARSFDMTAVVLRYANVYGPRQNAKGEAGVAAIFTERLLAGETLRVNGDGEQTRDYVYVGDVVDANMLTFERLDESGVFVYNIGRGIEISVLELVDIFEKVWKASGGADFSVEHGPELVGEQRRSVLDADRIHRELGWEPRVDIERGLTTTVNCFKEVLSS